MIWTRLYDPSRSPAHWTEIVRPGQYTVFIADIRTHIARDPEGNVPPEGCAAVAICEDLTEAVTFAQGVVGKHPELLCEVYDHEGKSGEPVRVLYNSAVAGRYQGRPAARRETIWGAIVLTVAVGVLSVDIRHGFTWIWGYVIGLKMLVIGVSLLVRGLSGLYEHRE